MKKILVLGGTRFFGRRIVELLLERGCDVSVLSRGRNPVPRGARHLQADRQDREALRAVVTDDYDAIIDNIAFGRSHIQDASEILFKQTGHYLFTSSASVYDIGARPPFFEEMAPVDPKTLTASKQMASAYALGKIEAEIELMSHRNAPWSIVRPPVVIGPNDHTLRFQYYVERVLDGGPILLVDGGRQRFHLADSEDLATGILQVLEARENAFGQAYNLCQRDCLTLRDLILEIARVLRRKPQLISVPQENLGTLSLEDLDPLGSVRFPYLSPPEKAIRELGFQPRPILEAVATTAAWCEKKNQEYPQNHVLRHGEIELANKWRNLHKSPQG